VAPATDDMLIGSAFDDRLTGGPGSDTVLGGGGNDLLAGGRGNDVVEGEAGVDTVAWMNPHTNYNFTTGAGLDIVVTDNVNLGGADIIRTSEFLQFDNGTMAIVMDANAGGNTLNGGDGRQALFGRAGNDTLNAGAGQDVLVGGAGNDTVNGGNGIDRIYQVGATDGRDLVDGGDGVDTYILTGVAGVETFNIYTRAAWLAVPGNDAGSLNGNTEIVITRNGTNNASVIAELDNIEEIMVNSLLTTADNGNNAAAPDQGTSDGDTINVFGNFAAPNTSLLYNTITINGSSANDTVNISGLESDHRIVFTANGGQDTVLGSVRQQDTINGAVNDLRTTGSVTGATTFGAQDGLNAMVGGSVQNALLGGSAGGEVSRGRTMIEMDDLMPLDLVDTGAVVPMFVPDAPIDLASGDHRSILTDYPVS